MFILEDETIQSQFSIETAKENKLLDLIFNHEEKSSLISLVNSYYTAFAGE